MGGSRRCGACGCPGVSGYSFIALLVDRSNTLLGVLLEFDRSVAKTLAALFVNFPKTSTQTANVSKRKSPRWLMRNSR